MDTKRYTGLIVKSGDKILLGKRNSISAFPGMWSIFGGKLQGDETTMDGAKREFFEETGVDVDGKDIKFIGLIPRYTRDGFKIKGLMYVYLLDSDIPITPDLANAIDGEEHTEWKYFTLNEIDPNKTGDFVYRLAEIILQ